MWFLFYFFDNFSLNFILQLCLVFGLYNFFFVKTPLKGLIVLFYFIIFFGVYLILLNLELFTSFLWFLEFTLVFLTMLFIFQNSLNIVFINKLNLLTSITSFFILLLIYLLFFNFNFQIQNYNFIFWTTLLNDYYTINFNYNLNDLFSFFLAYYILNNYSLILILLIILFASFLCIFLVKSFLKKNGTNSLNFIFNFISKNFLKKQTLSKQTILKGSTKIFKNK